MRALRVLMMTLLTSALLCATAYGAGYVLIHQDDARNRASETPGVTGATGATGATGQDDTSEPPAPQETEPATPLKLEFRLEPGDRGRTVRELQSRLFQLAWFPELTTGTYGGETREGVTGFQTKRSLKPTGVVDQRTWRRLTSMTKTPSPDQLFNVLHPGPALLGRGDTGEQVRDLQARLVTIAWLFGDVTGTYDAATAAAVRGFQEKREIPVTGEVDARTLERLHAMTYQPSYEQRHNITPEPGALDPRCKTGRALCIDKSTNSLRWVIDGKVQATYDVRFGSDELPTREGAFSVYRMSRDHVSSLYDTSMPFAMFFSGGQAVHYSPDFAATGYNGASHGCVNVRDYAGVAALFEQVRLGDTVIVYWS